MKRYRLGIIKTNAVVKVFEYGSLYKKCNNTRIITNGKLKWKTRLTAGINYIIFTATLRINKRLSAPLYFLFIFFIFQLFCRPLNCKQWLQYKQCCDYHSFRSDDLWHLYTFHRSMCTIAWYMPPFNIRSSLHICIIKLTFRDKHEPRSIQIIRMETTRSK